jgi:hypothetical protein
MAYVSQGRLPSDSYVRHIDRAECATQADNDIVRDTGLVDLVAL